MSQEIDTTKDTFWYPAIKLFKNISMKTNDYFKGSDVQQNLQKFTNNMFVYVK